MNKVRDEAAEKYAELTDGEFEYAKAWSEVALIYKAGWDESPSKKQNFKSRSYVFIFPDFILIDSE